MSSSTLSATSNASEQSAAGGGWMWLSPRRLGVVLMVWVILRCIFAGGRQLAPDEAYYWVWSRHLALSYFDHPPVVAWMIRLGTAVAGTNELGVRWPATVLGAATVLLLAWVARRCVPDARAAAFVAVALLASPIVNVVSGIVTPDSPASFFQVAALVCVLMIFASGAGEDAAAARGKWLWLAFGVLMGLALLSKYTSVLLGGAVLAALVCTGEGRRHLSTAWPWASATVVAAVFSPAIIWNAQHDWASFRFQLHHGAADNGARAIPHLLEYVGSQIGVWTPVFFGLCMTAMWSYWRRSGQSTYMRILLFSATLPLVFFAISSLRGRVEANWPLPAFFPAVLLTAHYLGESFSRRRVFWAQVAVIVALVATVAVHIPEAAWTINPSWGTSKLDELFGWRELAAKVDRVKDNRQVFGDDYQYASELSFYMSGRPDIWPMPPVVRPSAFNFFPEVRPPTAFEHVLVVSGIGKSTSRPSGPGALLDFQDVQYEDFWTLNRGRVVRKSLLVFADRQHAGDRPGNSHE